MLCVLKVFFDFLHTRHVKNEEIDGYVLMVSVTILVLNSVAMVNKAIPCLRDTMVFLYLDNDDAGRNQLRTIIERYGSKAKDCWNDMLNSLM